MRSGSLERDDAPASQTVLYRVDSGIATITLNRPERRNALSIAAAERLHQIWGEIDADDGVRVAVLTGADCGTFCAGITMCGPDGIGEERKTRKMR